MKKEKSLNFLCSKLFMAMFFALGMTFISSVDANAQSPLVDDIAFMTEQRDSFAPGTAKYDLAQDAIDYLMLLEAGINANPGYLNSLQDQTQTDPLMAAPLRKASPAILRNYTAAQLADFQAFVSDFNAGVVTDQQGAQKRQWILDANAY